MEHLNRIDQMIARSEATPFSNTTAHIQLMAQRKEIRIEFLKDFDRLHTQVAEANRWNGRITNRVQKSKMAPDMATVNEKFSDANNSGP
ncbi:hypothetical protein D3C84_54820 [compost metagenome]